MTPHHHPHPDERPVTTIDPQRTRVTMGLRMFAAAFLAVGIFTATSVWKLAMAVNDARNQMQRIQEAIPVFWTVSDHIEWSYENEEAMRRAGVRDYHAPDVRDIVTKRVKSPP